MMISMLAITGSAAVFYLYVLVHLWREQHPRDVAREDCRLPQGMVRVKSSTRVTEVTAPKHQTVKLRPTVMKVAPSGFASKQTHRARGAA